jgi:hypothetical protein
MRSYIASNGCDFTGFSNDSAYMELRRQQSVPCGMINEVAGFQQFE